MCLLPVGIPTKGQDVLDPQGGLTTAECYGHHKIENFRSMDLFPQVVTEVPKGQAFPFELTIKNPWLADLKDVSAYVNITEAPGLEFPGAQQPVEEAKIAQPAPGTNGPYARVHYPNPVALGAPEVYFAVNARPTATPLPNTPAYPSQASNL